LRAVVRGEGAYLVEVVLHLFTSDSGDAVRQASEIAALPFERIPETVAVRSGETSGLSGEEMG
jgi:hypothetical protein